MQQRFYVGSELMKCLLVNVVSSFACRTSLEFGPNLVDQTRSRSVPNLEI